MEREVLEELESLWDAFLQTEIAKAYWQELEGFRRWLRETGVSLLAAQARLAAERGNPVARDYAQDYIRGLLRRGGPRVLANMFAAYLVTNGVVSQYSLIKRRLVAGGESIATWLRLMRRVSGGSRPEHDAAGGQA